MFPFSAGQIITERDKNTLNHLYRDDVAVQQVSDSYFKNEKNEQIVLSLKLAGPLQSGDYAKVIKNAQAAIALNPNTIEASKALEYDQVMPDAESEFGRG